MDLMTLVEVYVRRIDRMRESVLARRECRADPQVREMLSYVRHAQTVLHAFSEMILDKIDRAEWNDSSEIVAHRIAAACMDQIRRAESEKE